MNQEEVVSGQWSVASRPSYWPLTTGHWPLFTALLALVAAGKAILYDTIDPDCFWHLRVAEQLSRDGIGPIVDSISFASIKAPWTPYSWLAELGMKAIWDVGGFQLAVIVQAIMMAGFVIFVALAARETTRWRNPLAIILATAIAMFLSLPCLSFRPVTFAILLLACCTWLLLRDRRMDERSHAVWVIVPITILITNCHFFAVLVPMWVGALLIGAIIEGQFARRYALMLGLTGLACCMTPMLPGVIESVIHYQFGDPMVDGGIIAEFQPIWKSPLAMGIVLMWLLALAVHTLARTSRSSVESYSGRGVGEGIAQANSSMPSPQPSPGVPGEGVRIRMGEWVWILLSLVLLLRLGRFAPVIAPLLAATFAAAMPQMNARPLASHPVRWAVSCVILVGLIRISFAIPTPRTKLDDWLNRHGPETPGYPTAAADFVAANVPPGRIINEFTWGGYLAWRLGENYPILLDGRTQLYTAGFWKTAYLGDRTASQPLLAAAQAHAAILPVTRSRFRDSLIQLGWKPAYRDDRAEVLLPPDMNASINP